MRLSLFLIVLVGVAPQLAAQTGNPPGANQLEQAESFIAKGDWKSADSQLTPWISAHPDDARALFDAAYVADAQNNAPAAEGFYRRSIQADPNAFESHLSLGLLLAREARNAEARPELEKATTLDRGSSPAALKAKAWRALARLDRPTDPARASEDLIQALKLSPETPSDTLMAAELADATHQPEAAEAAYKRTLEKEPTNTEARAGLAHLMLSRKEYAEAETLLRTALADSPNDLALSAELATALAAQNKGEALPLLQGLHQRNPQDADISRMLSEVLIETGDYAGADRLVSSLLSDHPEDASLQIAHGQNLLRELKYAEAAQAFTKATELAPSDPDAWSGLAFAASKTHQTSTTLHALTVRSKLVVETPSTYFLWATSYDSLHDREAAIKYYHLFLEASAGKYPDQDWQARQRLLQLEKKH